jgi:hypothetical protein
MQGNAVQSAAEVRRRAVLNIAFDDGHELTINDDDNSSALDPATGRAVDAGGCSMTLYKDGVKIAETLAGLLSYEAQFPYNGMVAEMPGVFKAEQVGQARLEEVAGLRWYWFKFQGLAV